MMRLYIARHGQTEWNVRKVYYGSSDVPIDEIGAGQCRQLAHKLREIKFDVVVSSNLKRAVQSADLMLEGRQLSDQPQRVTCEALSEMDFGLWEGMHYSEVQSKYPMEWNAWCNDWMDYRIPQGESFQLFYERVKGCFNQILQQYSDKTVLLVAHEGTLRVITTILLGLEPENCWLFSFESGMYSMFEINNGITVVRRINC